MDLRELLKITAAAGASDLFVSAGKPPSQRLAGQVIPLGKELLNAELVDKFRESLLPPKAEAEYRAKGSFDFGFSLPGSGRFRVNFFARQGLPSFIARAVPSGNALSFEELHLPPVMDELSSCRRGLILIAGTAGSGKTTTMAAMLNKINRSTSRHVLTIEDPIEFVHQDESCVVTQREIGGDTPSFADALRSAVRESPDVLVIGEMRDLDTMRAALDAALTGHLVLSTIHTADAVQVLERIINHFPEHLRTQTAEDLALCLQGVVAQRLVPRLDSKGLIPAVEVLRSTPFVRKLIASRNFKELEESIKRGHEEGMLTFNRALSELCKEGLVSVQDAADSSTNREEFMLLVRGMESGIETFRDSLPGEGASEEKLNMKRLLHSAVANGASDLLITAGSRPSLRLHGDLTPLAAEPLTPSDTKRLLFSVLTPRQRAIFEETREVDFALTVGIKRSHEEKGGDPQQHRFRVNGFYQRGNVAIAIRVISQRIPNPEELGLPPVITGLADKKHGLILVTGPTGHGKSTTLASLIDRINESRPCHIITVEDPIEYVHTNKKAVVEQREVHADTLSFSNALKFVLRQDPDVILVGEMRDTETISAALTAAETGHLVMATLHTNDAPQTIDRIIDSFPASQQNQIRLQLSGTLLGIVAQRLIPKRDGSGRIAAFEILIGSAAARSLIREGKSHLMQSVMETAAKDGMITMEKALKELYAKNLISREDMMSLIRTSDTPKAY